MLVDALSRIQFGVEGALVDVEALGRLPLARVVVAVQADDLQLAVDRTSVRLA